jgi:hypothetical protein
MLLGCGGKGDLQIVGHRPHCPLSNSNRSADVRRKTG